jgi:hypothetical protein
MKRVMTAQTPRVRMKDYRSFFGIVALDVNAKINVRANIFKCASPKADRLL